MSAQNVAADYEKIKNLFAVALEIVPEKRAAYFSETGADARLIAEVKSLLEAREEAGEFLNDVSAADSIQNSLRRIENLAGQTIDRFRLTREIGRGGMGIVYLAQREDFQQQVALKLIKRGMDSEAILERFRREREILAALDHPNIARLLDGGTTETDLPFFVMEFVEGVPLDEFCQTNNLSEKEKLELFRKVCEALIFAHQKLIVHRDLKPSNILVTENGTPKLLDFGIAKLLDSTEDATQTNQRVLTPAYASPEQIRGETIDTRSDVYSLGKILAELLLGEDFKNLKFTKSENSIFQKRRLNADLQNILAMSLREDAARRYGSVEKFSDDIRRHLVGLPVAARRDTFAYRTITFLKRNRIAAAVSALFITSLLVGIATTLWQAREARREREIAERRFDNLRKMSDEFTKEIHDAIQNLPGSLPARQMLLKHAVEQLDALAAESGDNSDLQEELAQAYFNSAQLPDMRLAEKDLTLRKEIEIYQNLISKDAKNTRYQEQMALGYIALGDITKVRGSVAGALELDKIGVSLLEQIVEKDSENETHFVNLANAYQNIAVIYIIKGEAENASIIIRKEQQTLREINRINPDEPSLKELSDLTRLWLGIEQTMSGDYKSAIGNLRQILSEYDEAHSQSPNDTRINFYLWVINRRLAVAFDKIGDPNAASEYFQKALVIIEDLSAQSPKDFGYRRNSAITNVYYGQLLIRQKKNAEAISHFRRAIELSRQGIENDAENAESKIDLARAEGNLGNALILIGQNKDGLDFLQKSIRIFENLNAPNSENAELIGDYNQINEWLKIASAQTSIR